MGNECSQWWLSSAAPLLPIIVMVGCGPQERPRGLHAAFRFSGNQAGPLVQPEPLKVLSEARAHQELFVRMRLE